MFSRPSAAGGAEARARDVVCDLVEQVDVAGATFASLETQHDLLHPVGAFAAGRAPTAGLVRV